MTTFRLFQIFEIVADSFNLTKMVEGSPDRLENDVEKVFMTG